MFRCKALGSYAGFEAGHSSMTLASVANAAPKPTSVAAPSSSSKKSKSWLAGLVIGAVTAGVVASGLEPAPITGRLPLQSADELLSAMCRGLAPAVLDHQREVDSWTMVNTSTLGFHVYALRAAGVRWKLALALPAALWKVADSIIHTWLPRQQV